MGKEFVVIAETGGRATAGRMRSCKWWFGGVVITICYNTWNFNGKPIGLYGIMQYITYKDGYGAIRTHPPM